MSPILRLVRKKKKKRKTAIVLPNGVLTKLENRRRKVRSEEMSHHVFKMLIVTWNRDKAFCLHFEHRLTTRAFPMVFSYNSSLSPVNPRYRTYSSNIIRVKTLQNPNETEDAVESIRNKKCSREKGRWQWKSWQYKPGVKNYWNQTDFMKCWICKKQNDHIARFSSDW